jgi:hydroxylamine reductase
VSGHDLVDLDELLQQTEGTGINVYTHGEMLPTNAYPGLKKYTHLAGNYGGSWWKQSKEFESFNGAILMTTNCITPVRESYRDRIFTTGLAGFTGIPHIADREPGQQKDFSALIARAKSCESPLELESGTIPIGFAHHTVLSAADKVIEAVKSGAIKRFVVMGGCDGRQKERDYFTQVAQALPEDTVILTAGCAKYRYNKLGLGEIAGIPRVLDAGQCNDSYSLIVIAQALAQAFGVSVNELPLSYDIAWYEQKAVIVLLALLSLGIRKIRLGPTLPAFLSPNVVDVLVKAYDLKPIAGAEEDVQAMLAGN